MEATGWQHTACFSVFERHVPAVSPSTEIHESPSALDCNTANKHSCGYMFAHKTTKHPYKGNDKNKILTSDNKRQAGL